MLLEFGKLDITYNNMLSDFVNALKEVHEIWYYLMMSGVLFRNTCNTLR